MHYSVTTVSENIKIQNNIFLMKVPAEQEPRPGQFYMLRIENQSSLLPRPISVFDYDNDTKQVSFLYQVVGNGTRDLSALKSGDQICLTGPLGNGFNISKLSDMDGKIALVGGGIGIAPLYYLAKKIKENYNFYPDIFLGFRDDIYCTDEFKQVSNIFKFTTDSGNSGIKGVVLSVYNPADYSIIYCCGPHNMMKAVASSCENIDTKIFVSLENKMACGIGACLVCTCGNKSGKFVRTCKEGPVFNGKEIDFDA